MSIHKNSPAQNRCFGRFLPGHSKPLMAMIEVTNRCNMSCPVCFSDANHPSHDVPVAEVRHYMEQLLEVTETPIPIQISGGEPTVRRDLPQIVSMAKGLGYEHIELITNGIKISQTPELLHELKHRGLTAVYLQFDGLKKETYLKIRGQDMTDVRDKAIQAVRCAGLCCTLAVAVTRGINDGEMGEIVSFGIDNVDTVRAINFQAAARFTGRFNVDGKDAAYSLKELLNLIETQTGVPAHTFRSEHLGHPSCNAMSYVFLVKGKLEPLFNYISREDMVAFLGENRRETVLDLFAGKKEFFSRRLTNPAAWKLIAKAAPIFGYNPLNVLNTEHILLFAKGFMEPRALDPERVEQCCYGISAADGVFSFCAYNNLYRFLGGTRGK
ncbi:MAG: radical SAM protein [Desulfatiglandales bacterium]